MHGRHRYIITLLHTQVECYLHVPHTRGQVSPELCIGHLVELHGLVANPDLNGKLGTLVRFDTDAQRWQLRMNDLAKTVRVNTRNLRRDRIEIVPEDGPTSCIMRPAWRDPCNPDESAHHILVEHVRKQRSSSFAGKLIVHAHNQPPRP